MRINTIGKTVEKKITEEGNYFFKIVDYTDDGYTNTGEQKLKINYTGKKVVTVGDKVTFSEDTYSHSENNISDAPNLLWRVMQIRDALKAPEDIDTDAWIGRYIIAQVYINEKGYPNVKGYSYAKQNDKLDPIPEAKMEEVATGQVLPEINIDEDEIPF